MIIREQWFLQTRRSSCISFFIASCYAPRMPHKFMPLERPSKNHRCCSSQRSIVVVRLFFVNFFLSLINVHLPRNARGDLIDHDHPPKLVSAYLSVPRHASVLHCACPPLTLPSMHSERFHAFSFPTCRERSEQQALASIYTRCCFGKCKA
jgi:hypothetical protein